MAYLADTILNSDVLRFYGSFLGSAGGNPVTFKLITNLIRVNHRPSERKQEAQNILSLFNQGREMDLDGVLDGSQPAVLLRLRQRRESQSIRSRKRASELDGTLFPEIHNGRAWLV